MSGSEFDLVLVAGILIGLALPRAWHFLGNFVGGEELPARPRLRCVERSNVILLRDEPRAFDAEKDLA